MKTSYPRIRKQKGAALVVGLLLLVILTLLAITGMNTTTTELVMAGNEQFRENAFNTSGAGLEEALSNLATVPQNGTPVEATGKVPNSTDTYSTESTYKGDDLNVPGYSSGKFVGFHYEVVSTGLSARKASSQQRQGAFVIQSSGNAGSFGSIVP